MKNVLNATKGYVKYAILSPILICLEAIIEVFIPLITKNIIDIGINGSGGQDYIIKWSLIMAGLAVVSFIGGVGSGYFATKASAGVGKNLRKNLYSKIQTYSFKDIDKFSTASLITRLTTDVSNIQMSFQMTIRICFRAPVLLIVTLISAYSVYPEFANIYAIAAPIMLVIVGLTVFPAIRIFRQMFKKYDKMNLISQENINAIRTVKAYTTEKREIAKFTEASNETKALATKADSLSALTTPIAQGTIFLCTLIVSYLGAMLVSKSSGTSEVGLVTMMITYGIQILSSLLMACGVAIMILMSKASLDRINEVLAQNPSIVDPKDPINEVKNGDVEFSNVSFSYNDNDNYALKDVSFKANNGEIIGIFGPTGSSKTTLVSLIARLYDASKGTVKVGDVDVKDYSLKSLRDACAVVLQKNTLFSGTVRSNMQWGNLDATDEEIVRALTQAQAFDFVKDKGGLDALVEEEGANFSGGQKQRLCIARALLKHPKVLILDDSTSAVDTKTDALIRESFKQAIPDTTKFIISQRISSIQFADKILILDDGKLVAQGTHEELLKDSLLYREIYSAQAKSSSSMTKEVKAYAA